MLDVFTGTEITDDTEFCDLCGAPDNCGDCDHTRLTVGDWYLMGFYVRECDMEFGPHEHNDAECDEMLGGMAGGYPFDPMDNIPWGTPDSWIPDNPDENGMRRSDFI